MQRFDDFECYTVLGLCSKASAREINERFRYLCRVRHPDKFATLSDDIRGAADEEFKRINTAYAVLRDPLRRAEYDRFCGNATRRSYKPAVPQPVFSPPNLDFGELRPCQQKMLTLTLHNRGEQARSVEVEFSTDDSWFSADVRASEAAGYCPMVINITATGPGGLGSLSEWVSVSLDGAIARAELRMTAVASGGRAATSASVQADPAAVPRAPSRNADRAWTAIFTLGAALIVIGTAGYVSRSESARTHLQSAPTMLPSRTVEPQRPSADP